MKKKSLGQIAFEDFWSKHIWLVWSEQPKARKTLWNRSANAVAREVKRRMKGG